MNYYQVLYNWIYQRTGHSINIDNKDRISLALSDLSKEKGLKEEECVWLILNDNNFGQKLIDLIMTSESYFMRYRNNMEMVANKIIPDLLKKGIKPRILSIACARGEEPYSLSMLLIDAGINPKNVEIKAVDISKICIQLAQKGEFNYYSFRRLPKYYITKYFTKSNDKKYILNNDIRQSVKFYNMDILSESVKIESGFHIIFCNNLIIYLTKNSINSLLKKIDYLMDEKGWLFVDSAEGSHLDIVFKRTLYNKDIFAYRKKNIVKNKNKIQFKQNEIKIKNENIFLKNNDICNDHYLKKIKKNNNLNNKIESTKKNKLLKNSSKIENFQPLEPKEIILAKKAYENKDFDKALKIYKEIINSNEKFELQARLGLAKIYADKSNDLEALENAEIAIALDENASDKKLSDNDKIEIYSIIAIILNKKGMTKLANEYFLKIKELNPNHPLLVMNKYNNI